MTMLVCMDGEQTCPFYIILLQNWTGRQLLKALMVLLLVHPIETAQN